LTTWATFLPSIGFILLGAPYVERLRSRPALAAALAGVTAAVVGVILNLALVFGRAALAPGGELDPSAVALSTLALVALLRFRVEAYWLVLGGALLGALRAAAL
jgi:chromate transporter